MKSLYFQQMNNECTYKKLYNKYNNRIMKNIVNMRKRREKKKKEKKTTNKEIIRRIEEIVNSDDTDITCKTTTANRNCSF